MLELSLLGNVTIRLRDEPLTRFRSQKEAALLAYLAHTGQTHQREALADLLWEARSTSQSLSNLRTALARLRKQVGDYLVVTPKTVAVAPAVHQRTDSARFQAMLVGAGRERSFKAMNALAQGLALYGGEFMTGFSLAQATRFNDWVVVEQERLRQIAMRGFRRLAAWQEEAGAFAPGVLTARQWVAWDPLDEAAQQQLMRLLAYDGRAAEALAVFETCRHLLQVELGIPPAPATLALAESIAEDALPAPTITPAPLQNLPRALTPLFGRQKEIDELKQRLIDPAYPLVSITGVGGAGKTSLALAAARALAAGPHPFADGIWFVSLEDIDDDTPERVRNEVAALVGQAMGLYFFHGESDLWSQLLAQLASMNLLLVLDNIEQFLAIASDLILELLEAGEGVHVLVTSRTTLALASSVAFPLAGLETPAEASPEAMRNESVRLFAERAARMPAPFHVQEHLADVVAICQFVEGMPLAIELAAASLGRLTVDEIMPALSGNMHLLNTTRRDLPARQRTLHAVFDYSWQLLDPREQTLLAQISVFRGGFTRQAAEAVLNGGSTGLSTLQDHALLNRSEQGRYRMHPLLRQLARERLGDRKRHELASKTLRRHSVYFAGILHSFEDDLRRGVGQAALQVILPEQANVRAAWQHAVEAEQWQTLAACLDGLHHFYRRNAMFTEEAALVDGAITALEMTIRDDAFSTGLLCRLLAVRAWDHLNLAQFENGLKTAERACDLAQELEEPGMEARARMVRARILSRQRMHEQALAQYEHVVALAKCAQDPILEADGWIGIGSQIIWQADVRPAQEPLLHGLNLCRTTQYKVGEMEALILLGTLAHRQEALAESIVYDEEALQLSRMLGDVVTEAEALGSLGVGLALLGDLAASKTRYEEALATFRRLNMPESEQWVMGELGHAARRLGDYATGQRHLTGALAIATRLKDLFWQAWVKVRLGEIWYEQGQWQKALRVITEAYETAEQVQNPRFLAGVLYAWGQALLGQAHWAQAEEKFQRAYELRLQAEQRQQAMPALAALAYVAYRQGRRAVAAAHAEQVWQTWQASPALANRADLQLHWMLGMVWEGQGDSRATEWWEKARALLDERSEKIPDDAARRMFLEQVPAHRAILDLQLRRLSSTAG